MRRGRDKEQEQDKGSSKGSGSKDSHSKEKTKDKAAPLNCPYLSLVRRVTCCMCTACAMHVRCMCDACAWALRVRCMCDACATLPVRCVCATYTLHTQVGSFYSLLLPLWLHAFPCDQLLVLQRDAFFGTPPPPAAAAATAATAAVTSAAAATTAAGAPSARWDRHPTQLPLPHARPATPSSRPPPQPPLPPPREDLLRATLRFVGLPSANASSLAQLPRFQPAPPHVGIGSNPIDEPLRRELNEYFAPFQEHLRKLLASHIKCFHERTSSKRKRRKTKVVV